MEPPGTNPAVFFVFARSGNESIAGCNLLIVKTAEEYRRNAEDSERMAQQARDAEAKRMFLDAAANWRKLAAVAERNQYRPRRHPVCFP
jgi:hypothetical protein